MVSVYCKPEGKLELYEVDTADFREALRTVMSGIGWGHCLALLQGGKSDVSPKIGRIEAAEIEYQSWMAHL